MSEYLRRLTLAMRTGAMPTDPGALYGTSIEHDNWCPFTNGQGDCTCNPTITVYAWAKGKQPSIDPPDDVFMIDKHGLRAPAKGH